HALNACATTEQDRVRWIADLCTYDPQTNACRSGYIDPRIDPEGPTKGDWLGAPTVTGGIVFICTNKGHLLVLADPSVPTTGPVPALQCSNSDYGFLSCPPPYVFVPAPKVLADVSAAPEL